MSLPATSPKPASVASSAAAAIDRQPDDVSQSQSQSQSPEKEERKRRKRTNAATGASAAGVRALSAQAVAFYFRAPAKAFFPARVDYLALAKAIAPAVPENSWSWRNTSLGLLTNAVRRHGWKFIPDHVLPPFVANVATGAALYTSYLHILAGLHPSYHEAAKHVYPPPPPSLTFISGFLAGTIQSILAAPLDALQVRYRSQEVAHARQYGNMWVYGGHKLSEIGLRGIFSGWGLSFLKDSLGAALFFCSFETVKSQLFYWSIVPLYRVFPAVATPVQLDFDDDYYDDDDDDDDNNDEPIRFSSPSLPTITPHYALEPTFLFLAGFTAAFTQQLIQYPLTLMQDIYFEKLGDIDNKAARHRHHPDPLSTTISHPLRHAANILHRSKISMRYHSAAYVGLYKRCAKRAMERYDPDTNNSNRVPGGGGSWRRLLFRGFLGNTVRQVPSTSAGLIIFELVRRKYGVLAEPVFVRNDGFDIFLV